MLDALFLTYLVLFGIAGAGMLLVLSVAALRPVLVPIRSDGKPGQRLPAWAEGAYRHDLQRYLLRENDAPLAMTVGWLLADSAYVAAAWLRTRPPIAADPSSLAGKLLAAMKPRESS